MVRYVIFRLLLALPILFCVSLIAFFLSSLVPGDVVRQYMSVPDEAFSSNADFVTREKRYRETAITLHKDKPLFYLALRSQAVPDTLHRILIKDQREAMLGLLHRHGHWPDVQQYRSAIYQLRNRMAGDTLLPGKLRSELVRTLEFLLITTDTGRLQTLVGNVADLLQPYAVYQHHVMQLVSLSGTVVQPGDSWRYYVPRISWYGFENQYHIWIRDLLKGDFGISLRDNRPVATKIAEAIRWTLMINIPVMILAFLISIPLGVKTAMYHGKPFDHIMFGLLLILFALPSFWLATVFVVFLTTPEYGAWTDLFPTMGIGNYRFATSFLERVGIISYHLALPVISLTVGSLAYLTRQMRQGILHEMRQPYILAARARGLPEGRIIWRQAFRNALFPMITIFASAFPAAISGSVIIEVIFNIPGMGRLMYESIRSEDWYVVFPVLLLAGVLTILGYLVCDLIYKWVDPRIKLGT